MSQFFYLFQEYLFLQALRFYNRMAAYVKLHTYIYVLPTLGQHAYMSKHEAMRLSHVNTAGCHRAQR